MNWRTLLFGAFFSLLCLLAGVDLGGLLGWLLVMLGVLGLGGLLVVLSLPVLGEQGAFVLRYEMPCPPAEWTGFLAANTRDLVARTPYLALGCQAEQGVLVVVPTSFFQLFAYHLQQALTGAERHDAALPTPPLVAPGALWWASEPPTPATMQWALERAGRTLRLLVRRDVLTGRIGGALLACAEEGDAPPPGAWRALPPFLATWPLVWHAPLTAWHLTPTMLPLPESRHASQRARTPLLALRPGDGYDPEQIAGAFPIGMDRRGKALACTTSAPLVTYFAPAAFLHTHLRWRTQMGSRLVALDTPAAALHLPALRTARLDTRHVPQSVHLAVAGAWRTLDELWSRDIRRTMALLDTQGLAEAPDETRDPLLAMVASFIYVRGKLGHATGLADLYQFSQREDALTQLTRAAAWNPAEVGEIIGPELVAQVEVLAGDATRHYALRRRLGRMLAPLADDTALRALSTPPYQEVSALWETQDAFHATLHDADPAAALLAALVAVSIEQWLSTPHPPVTFVLQNPHHYLPSGELLLDWMARAAYEESVSLLINFTAWDATHPLCQLVAQKATQYVLFNPGSWEALSPLERAVAWPARPPAPFSDLLRLPRGIGVGRLPGHERHWLSAIYPPPASNGQAPKDGSS